MESGGDGKKVTDVEGVRVLEELDRCDSGDVWAHRRISSSLLRGENRGGRRGESGRVVRMRGTDAGDAGFPDGGQVPMIADKHLEGVPIIRSG